MSASATSHECEAKSPEGRVCGRVAGHAGAHIHYGSGASWMPVDAETWDREARAREWLRDYDGAETVENLAALLAEMEERGRRAKFCSAACRGKRIWQARSKARNRGLRRMGLRDAVLAVVRAEPGLTLREVCARIEGAKYGSCATVLCEMAKSGAVVRDGGKYRAA